MNQHLNIFRYFNESGGAEFIENNLGRAFAICLQQDVLFFSHYIRAIVEDSDYEYLFSYSGEGANYSIDLQINTNVLELADIRKVYAVAMTGDKDLNLDNFLSLTATVSKEVNFTDVWILIKDIAFVIEVKRDSADCKQQLFNQVVPFLQSGPPAIEVKPRNFSWQHAVVIMEQVSNIQKLNGLKSGFISDFLSLSEVRYPHWFSSKPFALLPPLNDVTPKSSHARHLRIKQIINHSNQTILDYADRLAIGVNFGWASEIIPFFETIGGEDYVTFTIWPGNTKGQGHHIFNRESLNFQNKTELKIQGIAYPVEIKYHMKFSHFNRYVTALDFDEHDILKPVNTKENFYHRSGKRTRVQWEEFESFLDEHFKPAFEWRKKCDYEKYFVQSDRTYFTVSIGYVVNLNIPLSHFQNLDKRLHNVSTASAFIDAMVDAYQALLH